jgi:hypothetical protein
VQEQTGRNNLRLEILMGQLTAPGNLMLITMSLLVAALGHVTAAAPEKCRVFRSLNEIRQMYTSIACLTFCAYSIPLTWLICMGPS